MSVLRVVFSIFILAAAASAAQLTVKIIDPQSAAVSGAQVSLLKKNGAPLHTATSSGDGTVSFENVPDTDSMLERLWAKPAVLTT